MIENEPETMTAAPAADFSETGQMSETAKTSRRQPNPPAGEASGTRAQIGANPAAAVTAAPVQIETPEAVFSAAVRAINKRFQPGTLEHIEDHLPELDRLIKNAFDNLNNVWAQTLPGGRLDLFKLALRAWYDLIIRAIELFEDFKNDQ